MARLSTGTSFIFGTLVSIVLVFSSLIFLESVNTGPLALASHLQIFKVSTWLGSTGYIATSDQYVVSEIVQGDVQQFENDVGLDSGWLVTFSNKIKALGRHDLRSSTIIVNGQNENSSEPAQLDERALPPKNIYKENSNKGSTLLCYLRNPASAKSKAGSQWTDYSMLSKWGWSSEQKTADYNHVRKGVRVSGVKSVCSEVDIGTVRRQRVRIDGLLWWY